MTPVGRYQMVLQASKGFARSGDPCDPLSKKQVTGDSEAEAESKFDIDLTTGRWTPIKGAETTWKAQAEL
jgi:hypothetical protein